MKKVPPEANKIVYDKILSDEAAYKIYQVSEKEFELWEIPLYGGIEMYYGAYASLEEAIKDADNLT